MGEVQPANERVAREILPFKQPELIVQAWQKAIDTAPVENGKTTWRWMLCRWKNGDAPSEGYYVWNRTKRPGVWFGF